MTRHFLSIDDVTTEELLLLSTPGPLAGQARSTAGTLACLFQQPSLRTLSSFASAAVRAGLTPLQVSTTGDQLRDQCDFFDEVLQLGLTCDAVVVRSRESLPADKWARMRVPLINAGDGSNEHPSQTLVDLAAMRSQGLPGKKVVLMGNLRDHRVHHSLVKALTRLDVEVTCISPEGLGMPAQYSSIRSLELASTEAVDEVLSQADFVYLTPTKYWNSPFEDGGPAFKLDLLRATRTLKPGAKIFHPFPRLGELAPDLDYTRFDGYTGQVLLGPVVRYNLLNFLMSR